MHTTNRTVQIQQIQPYSFGKPDRADTSLATLALVIPAVR